MRLPLLTATAVMLALAGAARADESTSGMADQAAIDAKIKAAYVASDLIFDQHVDLSGLGAAWTYLDAEVLAEIGIGLAEAERILLRTHPAITSKEVLKVAIRTAGVTKKTETLKKVKAYAEKVQNPGLIEQIELAMQLAGASRSIAPSLSLDSVSLGAFIAYKQAQHDLNTALVFGSLEQMKELQEQVNQWSEQEPAIWNDLREHINEHVTTMEALGAPSRGGPDDVTDATEALNQLTAATRGWPYHPGYGGGPGFGRPGYGGGPSYGGYHRGGQFQQRTDINRWNQTDIRVQRPGAMIGGAAMSGLANGLMQKNPQKHAVAAGVLGALGQAMILNSNPSIRQQGGMSIRQQGRYQQYGHGYRGFP